MGRDRSVGGYRPSRTERACTNPVCNDSRDADSYRGDSDFQQLGGEPSVHTNPGEMRAWVGEAEITVLRARVVELEAKDKEIAELEGECERLRNQDCLIVGSAHCPVTAALRAENERTLAALRTQVERCRYRLSVYDTCEDNCGKASRYQEICPGYLRSIGASPEYVQHIESVLEGVTDDGF